ncbi:hypothetical protein [Kurthia massiliensis]|uniref:hypothetical protein n=1 Tax=Kurthia massiliensis TaxID=1033739 RepID=UPI0002892E3D|nr:hypothetical protein [Kurthia massiliensis]
MKIYTESELNEMKCAELREISAELNIPGRHKNPKRLLIENILTEYKNREEVSEPEKIVTVKETSDNKFAVAIVSEDGYGIMNESRSYKDVSVAIEQGKRLANEKGLDFSSKAEKTDDQPKKPEFVLLNEKDEEVYTSAVKLNVVKYAIENNICNAGWINRSYKTGEKIYIDGKSGKNTRPKNSKYTGVGYSVVVR